MSQSSPLWIVVVIVEVQLFWCESVAAAKSNIIIIIRCLVARTRARNSAPR